MLNFNFVILTGVLAHEPKLKKHNNGNVSCTFQVAINEAKNTNFVNCVALGELANVVNNWLKKGSRVGVKGKLQTIRRNNYNLTSILVEKLELFDNDEMGEY